MNSLATIIVSFILLGSTIKQTSGEPIEKRLSYNPTYFIWFFWPSGKSMWIPPKVEKAYFKLLKKRDKGGVCHKTYWYYCKTGVKISD